MKPNPRVFTGGESHLPGVIRAVGMWSVRCCDRSHLSPSQGSHTQHPLSTTGILQPLRKHLLTEISRILPTLAGRVLVPTVRGSGTSALWLCCSHNESSSDRCVATRTLGLFLCSFQVVQNFGLDHKSPTCLPR